MNSKSRSLQVQLMSGGNRPAGVAKSFASALSRSSRTATAQQSNAPAYFLSLAPGFVEGADGSLFDNTGDALGCPYCNTTKAAQPRLVLNYSKCCGRVMCQSCLNVELARGAQACPTPGCIGMLDRSSWSSLNIDKQRYKGELNYRKSLQTTFCLRREDFSSKAEYDDYLELVEDVIYDLSFGNSILKKAAERKVLEFKQKYSQQIYRVQSVLAQQAQSEAPVPVQADYSLPLVRGTMKAYIDLAFNRVVPNVASSAGTTQSDIYATMNPWKRRTVQLTASAHGYTRDRDMLEALEALSF